MHPTMTAPASPPRPHGAPAAATPRPPPLHQPIAKTLVVANATTAEHEEDEVGAGGGQPAHWGDPARTLLLVVMHGAGIMVQETWIPKTPPPKTPPPPLNPIKRVVMTRGNIRRNAAEQQGQPAQATVVQRNLRLIRVMLPIIMLLTQQVIRETTAPNSKGRVASKRGGVMIRRGGMSMENQTGTRKRKQKGRVRFPKETMTLKGRVTQKTRMTRGRRRNAVGDHHGEARTVVGAQETG